MKVKVLKYDPDRERVSLGLKQNFGDPWQAIDSKYHIGQRCKGKVVSLTDYGAFIELEPAVEDDFSGYDNPMGGATTIGDLVREKFGYIKLS